MSADAYTPIPLRHLVCRQHRLRPSVKGKRGRHRRSRRFRRARRRQQGVKYSA